MDQAKIKGGVRDLAHDLLTMRPRGLCGGETNAGYARRVCAAGDEGDANRVSGVPVDIRPIFETADQISRPK